MQSAMRYGTRLARLLVAVGIWLCGSQALAAQEKAPAAEEGKILSFSTSPDGTSGPEITYAQAVLGTEDLPGPVPTGE